MCICMHELMIRGSVVSAPAIQAMWCIMYRIRQPLSYLPIYIIWLAIPYSYCFSETFAVSNLTFIPWKMFMITSYYKLSQYLHAKVFQKTFAVAKQSTKNANAFHHEWKAIYSMLATVNAMVNFKQLYPYGSNLCGN